MNSRTYPALLILSILTLALAWSTWSPISQAADPAEKKMMEGGMMEQCQVMMEQKQKMREVTKAQDAELTTLVSKLANAPEAKQISVMAEIITQMVEQRIAIHARQAQMDEGMMKHMAQHMKAANESMSHCPMMPGMEGMGNNSTDAHKKHH